MKFTIALVLVLCSCMAFSQNKDVGSYFLVGGSLYLQDEDSYVDNGIGRRTGYGFDFSNGFGTELLLDFPSFNDNWRGVYSSLVVTYKHEIGSNRSLIIKAGMTRVSIEDNTDNESFLPNFKVTQSTDQMLSAGILFNTNKKLQYEVSVNTVFGDYSTNSIQAQLIVRL